MSPELTQTSPHVSPFASRTVWIVAWLLSAAFFCSEHSILTSQKIAFTLSADEMVNEAGGGNALRRLAFMGLAALGLALFVAVRKSPLRWPSPLALGMLAMVLYCTLSVTWSVDASMTVRRIFVLYLAFIGAVGIGGSFRMTELAAIALLSAGTLVLTGVACEIALGTLRPWSGEYRFSGSVHPNTQGVYLATVAFSALCLTRADAPFAYRYWFIIAGALVLLVLTKSRTSTAGVMLVFGCLWLLLSPNLVRFLVPTLGAWGLATALLAAMLSGVDVDHYLAKIAFMGRQEETESFSGRTTIWPTLTPHIQQRYWFGHGYDSFWTPGAIEEVTHACQWPVREAHSAYRETWLHLGLIGLTILLATITAGIFTSLVNFLLSNDACSLIWFGMLVNGLFNGMFESGMVMISLPTFLLAIGLSRLAFFRELAPARSRERSFRTDAVTSNLPAFN
jgi:O-antigen ligase